MLTLARHGWGCPRAFGSAHRCPRPKAASSARSDQLVESGCPTMDCDNPYCIVNPKQSWMNKYFEHCSHETVLFTIEFDLVSGGSCTVSFKMCLPSLAPALRLGDIDADLGMDSSKVQPTATSRDPPTKCQIEVWKTNWSDLGWAVLIVW